MAAGRQRSRKGRFPPRFLRLQINQALDQLCVATVV